MLNEIMASKLIAIILVCFITKIECLKFSSLDITYYKGVKAYSKERWSECIVQFEEALHLYKLYNSIIVNCRLQCNRNSHQSVMNENIEDLQVFEVFLNRRDCLTKCQSHEFENRRLYGNVSTSVLTSMHLLKPYEYLHLCYFQMNAMLKAASAAYTFLVAHPDDESMKNNVNYYFEQPEVDIKEVKNFESKEYELFHKLGLKAYKENNWDETIINMENTIRNYISWENTCRVECESQPEQEWSLEFHISLSYNVVSLLSCRQSCQNKLKPHYSSGNDFLADTLNYLQISYYHLNKLNDVAKTVASYLLLQPNDEVMMENKKIYQSLINEKNMFSERSDIAYYFKRDKYEKKLLNFFHKENTDSYEVNSA